MLRNADGGQILRGKRYEGIKFNVISVTRGVGGGCNFTQKKRYVTLELPPTNQIVEME